jgi:hypothetical protein
MMHPACSAGGSRLRFPIAGIKVTLFAVTAVLASPSIVQAASCLPSAEAVRKAQPNAWPKWTYGPKGERCWYSGEKPVFARVPLQLIPSTRAAARPPKQRAVQETDAQSSNPIPQPWALEYRWAEIFSYADPTAP